MKILYTLNSSDYGGMEQTVFDLLKGLSEFEKFVICPKGDLFEDFKKFAKVTEYKKISKTDFAYFIFLFNFIKKNKIDIIHTNEPLIGFYGIVAGFFAGCKVRISHTHTPISMWRVSFLNRLFNIVMNSIVINLFSTYEVALTNSIRKQKIKELIFPFKLKVIPNSLNENFMINIDNYKKKSSSIFSRLKIEHKFVFLYLSRLTREKNQILLLDAFSEFTKNSENSVLLLAGKGSDYQKLKKRVSALNLESKVFLLNNVSEEDKIELYCGSDCFVFPSLAEGFGITLLEAMYSCYPVISSNLEVLKEVSGNKVMFFKSNNIKSLVSKLKEAYNLGIDKDKKLKENKRFIRENYSYNKYILNYERLYQLK